MSRRQHKQAEEFVEQFAAAWAQPTTDRLCALLTEDVHLVAPRLPDFNGQHEARSQFDALLQMLPGIRAEVHRWAADGDQLFIEFEFHVPTKDGTVSWSAIDRFTLRDGKGAERVSWFDPETALAVIERR